MPLHKNVFSVVKKWKTRSVEKRNLIKSNGEQSEIYAVFESLWASHHSAKPTVDRPFGFTLRIIACYGEIVQSNSDKRNTDKRNIWI